MSSLNQFDINRIIQNRQPVDLNAFIKRGWEICQSNLGLFIGFFVLTLIIGFALGWIPGGSFVSIIVGGPLNAGNLIAAFKVMKGQPIAFGDFFKGFQSNYFAPTLLATLVISLFGMLCVIPAAIVGIIAIFAAQGQEPNMLLILVAGLLALAGLIGVIYLSISYVFAIPLIVSHKLSFWPAMEASRKIVDPQWGNMFGFLFVLGLINLVGALPCGLGLLFTAPLSSCAIAAAYERMVGLPSSDF